MKVYISGITGTGMGPLALMAKAAGFLVSGSDRAEGAVAGELREAGVRFVTGEQDGAFLKEQIEGEGVDWFVYTSALPEDHPELVLARERGLKISKRDELIAYLVEELGLKLVAVAGTHGKTTTTAMIVWAARKLGLPVAYMVGTTLPFAGAGSYAEGDRFLVYEADEYDRNFLRFRPWLAVVTTVSYDHPDIYPTREDYVAAFRQFREQSERVIEGAAVAGAERFELAGEKRREDAAMALAAVREMLAAEGRGVDEGEIVRVLNEFPGVGRRFERIREGVYSDYGHHPEEIAATVELAREQAEREGRSGVVVVYEPHQNTRQHEVREGYREAFAGAEMVYWLPTYLTREDPNLPVLRPEDFTAELSGVKAEPAEMGEELAEELRAAVAGGKLVLLMTAGPADEWFRGVFGGEV